MEFENIETILKPEKRLIHTILLGKPNRLSLTVVLFSILLMTIMTQIYWNNIWNLTAALPAIPEKVFVQHEWWRVVTAIFIHGDLGHFLSNMAMLGIFAFLVYGYFGFWAYPVLTLIGGSLVNLVALTTYPSETHLLGASGVVYLLGGFWLILFFFVQRQYSFFNRLLRILGVGLLLFVPTTFEPSTSYRTHAIGFVVGIAAGLIYFLSHKKKIQALEIYETTYVETEPTFH